MAGGTERAKNQYGIRGDGVARRRVVRVSSRWKRRLPKADCSAFYRPKLVAGENNRKCRSPGGRRKHPVKIILPSLPCLPLPLCPASTLWFLLFFAIAAPDSRVGARIPPSMVNQ